MRAGAWLVEMPQLRRELSSKIRRSYATDTTGTSGGVYVGDESKVSPLTVNE